MRSLKGAIFPSGLLFALRIHSTVEPISNIKTHTAEVIRKLNEQLEALIMTKHGRAMAIMQDVRSYEQTQETLALLKILALGTRQIEAGNVQPATATIKQIRAKRDKR
jgi:PHD/YefM family antitoxin component YafN of YafNO toxin-antitoxin module